MKIGYNDIVPINEQDRLLKWGEDIDLNARKIGIMAHKLAEKWRGKAPIVLVCAAVAYWSKQNDNTVRDWERIVRNVPQETWDAYEHVCGMSHFRVLIPHCKEPGDYALVLDKWLKVARTYSVRSLAAFVAEENGHTPGYYGYLKRGKTLMERIIDMPEATRRVKIASGQWLDTVKGELAEND